MHCFNSIISGGQFLVAIQRFFLNIDNNTKAIPINSNVSPNSGRLEKEVKLIAMTINPIIATPLFFLTEHLLF